MPHIIPQRTFFEMEIKMIFSKTPSFASRACAIPQKLSIPLELLIYFDDCGCELKTLIIHHLKTPLSPTEGEVLSSSKYSCHNGTFNLKLKKVKSLNIAGSTATSIVARIGHMAVGKPRQFVRI